MYVADIMQEGIEKLFYFIIFPATFAVMMWFGVTKKGAIRLIGGLVTVACIHSKILEPIEAGAIAELLYLALNKLEFKKKFYWDRNNILNIYSTWVTIMLLPHWVLSSGNRQVFWINFVACFGFFIVGLLLVKSRGNKGFIRSTHLFTSICLAVFLSFRSDTLFIGDAAVHWAYYVGPAKGLIKGLVPYNQVPLQYGLGPSLLSTAFGDDVWNGFYLTNCLLATSIAGVVTYIYWKRTEGPYSFWIGVLAFYCALFYSTSNFISYDTIPSGSVVRFAPLYLFVIGSYFCRNYAGTFILDVLLMLLAAFWSFESYLICAIIALTEPILVRMLYKKTETPNLAYELMGSALKIIISFIAYLLLFFLIYGQKINLQLYSIFFLGYSSVIGLLPARFSDQWWIFLLILYVSAVSEKYSIFGTRGVTTIRLMLGVYGACFYYVGRSTPWNLTVLMPELCMLVLFMHNSRDRELKYSLLAAILVTSLYANSMTFSGIFSQRFSIDISKNIQEFSNYQDSKVLSDIEKEESLPVLFASDDPMLLGSSEMTILNPHVTDEIIQAPLSMLSGLESNFVESYLLSSPHYKNKKIVVLIKKHSNTGDVSRKILGHYSLSYIKSGDTYDFYYGYKR